MPLELERIPATRLEGLDRERTVFFFPVGGLEDHGPHLPMGLDLREAERLCWMAAERMEKEMSGWTAVIAPRAPLGVDSETTAWALQVRGHVLRDWLVDACSSLARRGFRHFVSFTGQLGPRQLTAIEEAGKFLRKRTRVSGLLLSGLLSRPKSAELISACSALPGASARVVRTSPFWPDPEEHGGKRDTSVGLALASGEVDASYSGLAAQGREGTHWSRFRRRSRDAWKGRPAGQYWGSPAEASAAHGQAVLQGSLDEIFPKLRAAWEGANPNAMFRSWYSLLPPNQSFFKAWFLFVGSLLLLTAWVYMSFLDF